LQEAPKRDILPLVTSVTGGPGWFTAEETEHSTEFSFCILHSAFRISSAAQEWYQPVPCAGYLHQMYPSLGEFPGFFSVKAL